MKYFNQSYIIALNRSGWSGLLHSNPKLKEAAGQLPLNMVVPGSVTVIEINNIQCKKLERNFGSRFHAQ